MKTIANIFGLIILVVLGYIIYHYIVIDQFGKAAIISGMCFMFIGLMKLWDF